MARVHPLKSKFSTEIATPDQYLSLTSEPRVSFQPGQYSSLQWVIRVLI